MSFDEAYFRTFYADYHRQNPARKLLAYLRIIRKHVPSGRLLDIGCSYGLFVEAAAEFFICTGMDVDQEVVTKAANRVRNATFVVGALPNIPHHGFDVITALDVIEHVPNPDAALAAINAALRPGGISLIVVPVYDGPLGWLARLFDRDPTHLHRRSRHYWFEMTSRHMELVGWEGFLRKLIFSKWYLHISLGIFGFMAPAVALILRHRAAPKEEDIK